MYKVDENGIYLSYTGGTVLDETDLMHIDISLKDIQNCGPEELSDIVQQYKETLAEACNAQGDYGF